MKSMEYKTKPRQAILAYMKEYKKETDKYITPKEIIAHFQKTEKKISTATVYRVLDNLEKRGIIKKYDLEGMNSACFEYLGDISHCDHHYHLKCDSCGKIVHFHCDEMKAVSEHLNEHHGFTIDTPKTMFYGVCSCCSTKGKK